jgi:putative ABC transport system substrate-binding protein
MPTLAAKRLELLRELVPGLRRVAFLGGPTGSIYETLEYGHVNAAASALGISVVSIPIATVDSVADGFTVIDREKAQAVIVGINAINVQLIGHIIDECLVRDLPSMYPWTFAVTAGALMSYGPTSLENNAGAARYVDRLLKGANVADLPFQEPTEFTLAINRRTARAIKITIPQTLFALANELID